MNHGGLEFMSNCSALPIGDRRTHIYGVGLPKSGTGSLAQLFSNYRSFHEPENRDFIANLNLYLRDCLSQEHMRRLLQERDRKFQPEVESSHFYVYVVDLLVAMHPRAKFILTIREPLSWLRSFINDTYGFDNGDRSSVWNAYRDLRMRTAESHPPQEAILADAGLYSLEGYFSYWRMHIERVIDAVPPERLFVLPTSEISYRLQAIADFAGVPASSLRCELSHSHKATRELSFVEALDPIYLAQRCIEICRVPLGLWFPEDLARLARVAEQATTVGGK
jgi:hypothetical protein